MANILEDVVNIVDRKAESLGDLKLGDIIVLFSGHSFHHFIGIKYGNLANILENEMMKQKPDNKPLGNKFSSFSRQIKTKNRM